MNILKIRELRLDSREEATVKIVKELLLLFHVETVDDPSLPSLAIESRISPEGQAFFVETCLELEMPGGGKVVFSRGGLAHGDERRGAEIRRLIKRNLYDIFRAHLHGPPAPWGILHGVRPTKIVHRWIRSGLDKETIEGRLQEDYRASAEKSELITEMAFRQLPFLHRSDERTVSIYVGIPFCLTRCLYCSFPSHLLPKEEALRTFLSALEKDIEAAKESVREYGFRVQSIYVGGGTPTSLPDSLFAEMLGMVRHAFHGPSVAEFTVEAGRPDSMSGAKLSAMAQMGVTRASANPQTMQQRTLDRIGRRHTPEDIARMVRQLREAGIPQINMDLILGLPGETAEDVEDSVQKVIALGPDDITLHALALKRGSRLKLHLADYGLPSDGEARRMSEAALRRLRSAGYQPYYLYRQGYMSGKLENLGCCREGAESLYNIQIMEEHQTILGMGGAATTKAVDLRAGRLKACFHAKDLATYLRDIDYYIEKRNRLLAEVYGNRG